jgi:hypothetical protein
MGVQFLFHTSGAMIHAQRHPFFMRRDQFVVLAEGSASIEKLDPTLFLLPSADLFLISA